MLFAELLHVFEREFIDYTVLVKSETDHITILLEERPKVDDGSFVQLFETEGPVFTNSGHTDLPLHKEEQTGRVLSSEDEVFTFPVLRANHLVKDVVLGVISKTLEEVNFVDAFKHEHLFTVSVRENLLLQERGQGRELSQTELILFPSQTT